MQIILLPVLLFILLIIIIILQKSQKPNKEGFTTTSSYLKCPVGYKFFNDSYGESFCCGGTVNKYSHVCEVPAPGGLCAFKPNTPDPRGPTYPILPLCTKVIEQTNTTAQQSFCPTSLPRYATDGKCCKTGTTTDGADCTAADLLDKSRYCVINTPKPGEQLCSNIKLGEIGICPADMSRITYNLGDKERNKYGSVVNGVSMPVCFNMTNACIPDAAVTQLKTMNIFNDKPANDSWKYACSGYQRLVVGRESTGTNDYTYV
jgi:hypothetical protein